MKKLLGLLLATAILMAPMGIASAENVDAPELSAYSDSELLALLDQVQGEVVSRNIEKTAHLIAGKYTGGRDIPVGSYILSAAGHVGEYGIVSLRSVNDPEEDYPSKLYEFKEGEETYSVFVTIEEGDTLILPFPYDLTISAGVMFK